MDWFGCHTFSMVNAENKVSWVKFHLICQQKMKGLTVKEAKLMAGEDPNFLSRDLHKSIENGNYPR